MKKKKTIFGALIAILLVAGYCYFASRQRDFYCEMVPAEGLFSALYSFVEKNQGRMPENWDELEEHIKQYPEDIHRDLEIVRKDGATTIVAQGGWVSNAADWKIGFGIKPDDLKFKDGELVGKDGNPILLLDFNGESRMGGFYESNTRRLVEHMQYFSQQAKTEKQGEVGKP